MVVGSFPIVKLAYLAIKQVSRPIANQIKRSAKASPFFGKYVCMPPAQLYHSLEINLRLRLMGLGKAKHVHRLTDEMAIELGAEMLGEFVIFAVAAGTILMEYHRSAAKENLKEKEAVLILQQRAEDMNIASNIQDTKIRELQRTVANLEMENQGLIKSLFSSTRPAKTEAE